MQIVLYGLHEDPALVDKRTDQPVTQVFIFPIVTPLSEIKGLVDYQRDLTFADSQTGIPSFRITL